MKHKITIVFDDKKSPLSVGFRVNWVDGEDKKAKINLSCGAGVASPYMVFSYQDKKTGKTRYAVGDITPVVHALATALATP